MENSTMNPADQTLVGLDADVRNGKAPTIDRVLDGHGVVQPGGSTDEKLPMMMGSAEPNTWLTLWVDGKVPFPVFADENGHWESPVHLKGGRHEVTIEGADGQISAPFVINVDLSPPLPAAPTIEHVFDSHGDLASGGTTENGSVELKGTGQPNTYVTIFIDGKSVGVAYVNASGEWSSRVDLQNDGLHQITVQDTNGASSNAFELRVAAGAPELPAPTIDHVSDAHGDVVSGGTAEDSLVSLQGSAEPYSFLTIYIDGQAARTTVADPNGKWWQQIFLAEDGHYQITVQSADGKSSAAFDIAVSLPVPTLDHVYGVDGELNSGASVSDGPLTLEGTGQPYSRMDIYADGKLAGYCMTDANGHWEAAIYLGDGQHQLTVTAQNGKTTPAFDVNVSVPSPVTPTIDHVAEAQGDAVSTSTIDSNNVMPKSSAAAIAAAVPTIEHVTDSHGEVSQGGSTDNRIVKLEGTGEPNTLVTVWVDARESFLVKVDANGHWSTEVYLQAGQHQLAVEGAGQAGNTFDVHVGYAPSLPSAPTIEHVADSRGELASDGNAQSPLLTLSGLTQPYALVLILVDGKSTGYQAYADADGRWSTKVGVWDGEHQITVRDGDGTVGDTFSVNVSVPAPTIDHVADSHGDLVPGGTTSDGYVQLKGTGLPNTQVIVSVDGKPAGAVYANDSGEWSYRIDVQGGQHHITVRYPDGANSSAFDIQVGQAPEPALPALTIDHVVDAQGDLSSGGTTKGQNVTLQGSGAPNSLVTIYIDGRAGGTYRVDASGQWKAGVSLNQNGDHTIMVKDSSGAASAAFDIHVAYVPPAPTIDHVTDAYGDVSPGGSTTSKSPVLKGTGVPNTSVIITVDGNTAATVKVDANGQWSVQLNIGQGDHQFVAHGANGTSSASFDIRIDPSAAPATTIDHVSNAQGDLSSGDTTASKTLLLKGTGAPNMGLTITVDGYSVATTNVDASGQWSVQLSLSQGDHRIVAQAVNGAPSAPFEIHIDPSAVPKPPAPTIDHVIDAHGDVSPGGTTGDKYVLLQGTALANTRVTILVNGKGVATAAVDDSGHWEQKIGLGESREYQITVKDFVGAVSDAFDINLSLPPAVSPTIDLVTGAHGDVHAGGTSSDYALRLEGTGQPNTNLGIVVDGRLTAVIGVDATGHWKTSISLQDGQHKIVAESSATGKTSAAFDIAVSWSGPTIDHVSNDHGALSSGASVSDGLIMLEGTGKPNSLVKVVIDGTQGFSGFTDANGHWETPVYLQGGQHQLTVQAEGKTSAAFEVTVAPPAGAQDEASHDQLSLADVLSAGEADLFAAEHAPDHAQLSVHDMNAVAVDSSATPGSHVMSQDLAALHASLVLPHEQAHAVM